MYNSAFNFIEMPPKNKPKKVTNECDDVDVQTDQEEQNPHSNPEMTTSQRKRSSSDSETPSRHPKRRKHRKHKHYSHKKRHNHRRHSSKRHQSSSDSDTSSSGESYSSSSSSSAGEFLLPITSAGIKVGNNVVKKKKTCN